MGQTPQERWYSLAIMRSMRNYRRPMFGTHIEMEGELLSGWDEQEAAVIC